MFDKSQMLQALSQFAFGMLGAVIVQIFLLHHAQKIVTIDITGLVKSFESEALKQKLPADELSLKVSKFGEALNAAVDKYSADNHVILVPREVVISGAVDKTSDVRDIIKKGINS